MLKAIKRGYSWVVYSSANQEKFSRTLKGVVLLVATSGVTYFGWDSEVWSTPAFTEAVNQLIVLVNNGFAFMGSFLLLTGAVRKLVLTIENKNDPVK